MVGYFFFPLNGLVRKKSVKEEYLVPLSEFGLGIRLDHPKILDGVPLSRYIHGTLSYSDVPAQPHPSCSPSLVKCEGSCEAVQWAEGWGWGCVVSL